MSSTKLPGVAYRAVTRAVDELAASKPEQVFAIVPRSSDIKQGFREVNFGRLAKVINALSRWIERTAGAANSSETIAYMGYVISWPGATTL